MKFFTANEISITSIATVHHTENRLLPRTLSTKCEYVMRPNRLPAVVKQLRHSGKEGAWAVFMFRTTRLSDETSDNVLNLQYSVEKGIIGFDWVLIGPRNCADIGALTDFIHLRDHKVETRNMNGVTYLRVEDGDIIKLGLDIISGFYCVASDYAMGLLAEGFPPPSNLDSDENS